MAAVMRTAVGCLALVTPLLLVACGGRVVEIPGMDSGADLKPEAASDALVDGDGADSGDAATTDAGLDALSLDCPTAMATIQTGALCSVASGIVCNAPRPGGCQGSSAPHATCTCAQGVWSCSEPLMLPCPPPPTPPSSVCPAPTDIMDGKSCAGIVASLLCRGNPTLCNGTTFYDALRCDGNTWVTVAGTVCGIDGGGGGD